MDNKILLQKEYYREYIRKRRSIILCDYCNVYCTKKDKHYKTDEHMINIAQSLHLNLDLLLISKKVKKK